MSDMMDEYFALYAKGAYREAYAVLRNLMATQPGLSEMGDLYWWCAGLELTLSDDLSKARELLGTALRFGCTDMASYNRLHGYVLWRTGEREAGIRELEKSVELEPSAASLSMLGRVLSADGDKRAADIWGRVLEQDPQDCQAYIYLGMLAVKTGDKGTAFLMAKKAEELHPTAHNVEEIARLYAEAGEVQMALDKYLEAERAGKETNGALYGNIAACYFELGNTREGCVYLERAHRCNPDYTYVKEMWELYKDRCAQRD
jgi:tetratricopeptide (TPR) repeat protein